MSSWKIEIDFDGQCCPVWIEAEEVEKIDYQTLAIDGNEWKLPSFLSFAEVCDAVSNHKEQEDNTVFMYQGNINVRPCGRGITLSDLPGALDVEDILPEGDFNMGLLVTKT